MEASEEETQPRGLAGGCHPKGATRRQEGDTVTVRAHTGGLSDFIRTVWRHRGSREAAEALGFEYTDTDDIMAMEMTEACDESGLRDGEELALTLAPDAELRVETEALERLRTQFGCDPMDVDAMLEVSCPRS